MTAATPTVEEALPGLSAADRAALRSARIRGGVMVALALLAFQYVPAAMSVPATFSFWLTKQGGEALTISTNVGLVWLVTGLVTGIVGMGQLVRGPAFQWRRGLLVVLPCWIAAAFAALLAGQPGEPDQPVRRDARLRGARYPRCVRRHPVRAVRDEQHRDRGQVPDR